MTEQTPFDPGKVLDDSITDVTQLLGGFTAEQLAMLLEAEKAGAKRKGMIAAIEDEQEARKGAQGERKLAIGEVLILGAASAMANGADASIMFTHDDDREIKDLPALGFGKADFTVDHRDRRVTLKKSIEFPQSPRRLTITKAWMLVDGRAVAMTRLIAPLPIGGSSSAVIPGGFLGFIMDASEPEAADDDDGDGDGDGEAGEADASQGADEGAPQGADEGGSSDS